MSDSGQSRTSLPRSRIEAGAIRVYVVDDIKENASLMRRILAEYEVRSFTNPLAALEASVESPPDILVTDQRMPELTGLELVTAVRKNTADFAAIIVSAYTDSEVLIDAVNSNLIYKFVVKPFSVEVLSHHVHRAAEHLVSRRQNERLNRLLVHENVRRARDSEGAGSGAISPFDVFLGSSPATDRLQHLAQLYAVSDETVLISGETGTGKELAARAVHALSPRHKGPFVAINCAAVPESMLESELFGHERGAFTGAERKKQGLVELADGGTLFLDEIGELPAALQPKLLRVLQFGTFVPVGSTKERRIDARIVSATNRNLRTLVAERGFRDDLYYRVSSFQIHLAPLRRRREDIPAIIDRIAGSRGFRLPPFEPAAMELLLAHPFPGNVRELESVLERLRLLHNGTNGDRIGVQEVELALDPQLEAPVATTGPAIVEPPSAVDTISAADTIDLAAELEQHRRRIIERVFAQEGGNISRTARRVSMSRQGLKNKLKEWGLIRSGSE